jgi:hypothetical protein
MIYQAAQEFKYKVPPREERGAQGERRYDLGRATRRVTESHGITPSEMKGRVNDRITDDMDDRAAKDPELYEHASPYAGMGRGEHREMVRKHIDAWAGSAGDGYRRSLALQIAAQKHWDLPNHSVAHLQSVDDGNLGYYPWRDAQYYYKKHHVFLHHFLDSVYQATQEHLRDTPELLLYRGHDFNSPTKAPGWALPKGLLDERIRPIGESGFHQTTRFHTQPLSSWSSDREIARGFSGPYGHVLTSVVPREHIWSTAHTGPGCLNEQEVITIGGHGHAHHTFNSPRTWNRYMQQYNMLDENGRMKPRRKTSR